MYNGVNRGDHNTCSDSTPLPVPVLAQKGIFSTLDINDIPQAKTDYGITKPHETENPFRILYIETQRYHLAVEGQREARTTNAVSHSAVEEIGSGRGKTRGFRPLFFTNTLTMLTCR